MAFYVQQKCRDLFYCSASRAVDSDTLRILITIILLVNNYCRRTDNLEVQFLLYGVYLVLGQLSRRDETAG